MIRVRRWQFALAVSPERLMYTVLSGRLVMQSSRVAVLTCHWLSAFVRWTFAVSCVGCAPKYAAWYARA